MLIHDNYLSQKDIEICLGFDIDSFADRPEIDSMRTLHEVLKSEYGLDYEFFGGSALKSFPGGLDEETYNKARPHFQAALEAFRQAGKSLHEFVQFLKENFGEAIRPYLKHFLMEDRGGKASEPSAEKAVEEVFPHEVTPPPPPAAMDTGQNAHLADFVTMTEERLPANNSPLNQLAKKQLLELHRQLNTDHLYLLQLGYWALEERKLVVEWDTLEDLFHRLWWLDQEKVGEFLENDEDRVSEADNPLDLAFNLLDYFEGKLLAAGAENPRYPQDWD